VVVVDEGTGVALAVFYTSVPANLNENNVDTLVSSLQITTTAQPGGLPGAETPGAGSQSPAGTTGTGMGTAARAAEGPGR
jgi:hypothetical protein